MHHYSSPRRKVGKVGRSCANGHLFIYLPSGRVADRCPNDNRMNLVHLPLASHSYLKRDRGGFFPYLHTVAGYSLHSLPATRNIPPIVVSSPSPHNNKTYRPSPRRVSEPRTKKEKKKKKKKLHISTGDPSLQPKMAGLPCRVNPSTGLSHAAPTRLSLMPIRHDNQERLFHSPTAAAAAAIYQKPPTPQENDEIRRLQRPVHLRSDNMHRYPKLKPPRRREKHGEIGPVFRVALSRLSQTFGDLSLGSSRNR